MDEFGRVQFGRLPSLDGQRHVGGVQLFMAASAAGPLSRFINLRILGKSHLDDQGYE